MTEIAWFTEFGPLGLAVGMLLLMMRREQKRDRDSAKFFLEREKSLATIGEVCHNFSEATEKRATLREERLVAVVEKNERCFDKLLTYLTKVNGQG